MHASNLPINCMKYSLKLKILYIILKGKDFEYRAGYA